MVPDKETIKKMICELIDNNEIIDMNIKGINIHDGVDDGWIKYQPSGYKSVNLMLFKKYGLVYVNSSSQYRVFLDNKEIKLCYAADDINGIVWVYKIDENDQLCGKESIKGTVKIIELK